MSYLLKAAPDSCMSYDPLTCSIKTANILLINQKAPPALDTTEFFFMHELA